jgi:hypothetical protein
MNVKIGEAIPRSSLQCCVRPHATPPSRHRFSMTLSGPRPLLPKLYRSASELVFSSYSWLPDGVDHYSHVQPPAVANRGSCSYARFADDNPIRAYIRSPD